MTISSISSSSINTDIYSLFASKTSNNSQNEKQASEDLFAQKYAVPGVKIASQEVQNFTEEATGNEASTKSIIENIKEGEGILDAIRKNKQEEFQSYFNEELEKNGGNVNAAIKVAEARVKGGLSDEEMYESIMALAGRYKDIDKEISDQLIEYAEELAKQMLIDPKKALNKMGNESERELFSLISSSKGIDSDKLAEEKESLDDTFIEKLGLVKNSEENSEYTNNYTNLQNSNKQSNEQEKREIALGIKQYEKIAFYS